jgi:flagellar biosynthesis GTPase FlhF
MWVEGKKQEDGLWILRVGEPLHNHPGRPPEGWAVQRKRTWGIQNGKIGVGGVTAKEEKERLSSLAEGTSLPIEEGPEARSPKPSGNTSHSLESGGLVWRIVEQEMLRKRSPGQGRDRGVGRTVKILQERLPGIHIFKRDVYNIRAQIKRARKAAGQQIGDGLDESEEEEGAETLDSPLSNARSQRANPSEEEKSGKECSEIDPTLVAQCSDALQNVNRQETETHRLRDEVSELREALAQRTKEVEERDAEIESLRAQLGLANMALYNGRYSHAH